MLLRVIVYVLNGQTHVLLFCLRMFDGVKFPSFVLDVVMEKTTHKRSNRTGIEENTLAILESTEAKDTRDTNDDRIAFIEAVRAASFIPETETAPTYPDAVCSERQAARANSIGPPDFSGFTLLIQELGGVVNGTNFQAVDTEYLRNMLLLQYLVNVLEGDFLPQTSNWNLLRESLLNILLGSRRINYKVLMKDCLSILSGLCQARAGINNDHGCSENSGTKPSEDCDPALVFALLDAEKNTCVAFQKLLTIIMELDTSKINADMLGHTTRADGVRTPLMEIIVDELNYDRDIVSPFLQVGSSFRRIGSTYTKLHYILQPSVRTRRSNGPKDEATFDGILKYFSNSINLRNFVKKMSTEIVQLLLAHAFQAHLTISSQYIDGNGDSKENIGNSSLVQICEDIICAFKSLRAIDE
ncbi:hypothetical protein JRO89_XS06G0059500 [Xanthoceras sorbifolium]|uniref:Uncharacterized protein n=1 Tax=Xanthoceras sorbifolium TaxID=99658 RepID=A0ABQ8HX15_9ROSI|nr:hypothetical protein JRO89_XS06G0059500 [Xanthoceras sorbifolium]